MKKTIIFTSAAALILGFSTGVMSEESSKNSRVKTDMPPSFSIEEVEEKIKLIPPKVNELVQDAEDCKESSNGKPIDFLSCVKQSEDGGHEGHSH